MRDDLFLLGNLLKPKGLRGEIKMSSPINVDLPGDPFEAFIFKQGKYIPYLVNNIKPEAKDFLIKFHQVHTVEESIPLIGLELFAKKIDFKFKKAPFSYVDLSGYSILDTRLHFEGIIEEVLELPQQYVAVIIENGIEILIPLNDELIQSIDKKNKLVFCKLPDGLLEIYRSP